MKWEDHTVHTLKRLKGDESYGPWAEALEDGEMERFPEELEELVRRLAGALISELEVGEADRAKVLRMMEMAALAGRTL